MSDIGRPIISFQSWAFITPRTIANGIKWLLQSVCLLSKFQCSGCFVIPRWLCAGWNNSNRILTCVSIPVFDQHGAHAKPFRPLVALPGDHHFIAYFNMWMVHSDVKQLRMADGSENPECVPIHSLSSWFFSWNIPCMSPNTLLLFCCSGSDIMKQWSQIQVDHLPLI